MATINYYSAPSKRLNESIDGSASSFKLDNILGWDGTAMVAGDFGSILYAVFRNSSNTLMEIMEIDPTTIASSSITISKRGLQFDGNLSTEVAANKLTWVKGDTIVEVGSNPPQLLNHTVRTVGAQTVAGVKTFSSIPVLPASDPTAANEAARKSYVDTTATGSATYDQNLIGAVAGATIAAGESIYLKESDGEWYLTDASATATSENVIVGIAQGAGTDGAAISGGVLVGGIDKTQTYTAGSKYYLSDTAGALATSAGTIEVLIGTGDANNNLVFEHIVTLESLSANEKTLIEQIAAGTDFYAATSVGTDAYAITITPAATAYAAGQKFRFKADVANTGACTLDVSGLGAKAIKKQHDQDPATGDIELGAIVEVVYDGTSFQMTSQTALTTATVDVQTFTSNGTWTKPTGALSVEIYVIGGGGGGGGGERNNGGSGGGGGGGGSISFRRFIASALGSSETVTVGTGGAGGAGASSNGAGTIGSAGVDSSFGTTILLQSSGGLGGAGGTTGSPAGGAGGPTLNGLVATIGGAGGTGGDSTTGGAGVGTTVVDSARGGGGGGGTNAGTGGAGGAFTTNYTLAGGAGGTTGAIGTIGNSGNGFLTGGSGGGGGGGNGAGSGGAGGAGVSGSGGGGGGATEAGTSSGGAGGAGGAGFITVITYL